MLFARLFLYKRKLNNITANVQPPHLDTETTSASTLGHLFRLTFFFENIWWSDIAQCVQNIADDLTITMVHLQYLS